MTKLPAGFLFFALSKSLATVHRIASEIMCLKSDVHLMDVGLLASEAWVAAWAEESETAKRLANLFGGFTVPLSSAAALALQSLGPALRNEAEFVGLLEVTDTKNLANFFLQISDCEHRGWEILEIRIRKSGPSGAHAFFAKLPNAQRVDSPNFAEIGLEGEYRKFF